jgi:membrane protein DedA with SNARE-associated domain
LISIPAGMANMPMLPFLLYTTLGSAVWVGFLTYSGYLLGTQYKLVEEYIDPISKIVLVGILVLFFLWVFKRKSQQSRR